VAAARGRRPGRRAKFFIAVLVVALLVPLGAASLRTLRFEQWIGSTETAARQWVKGTGWRIEAVKQVGDGIDITTIGPGEPPPIASLQRAVRAEVPPHVVVRVVEGSGKTVEL